MPMLDEIADDLAANGFGTVGTDIFTHAKPPKPDSAMSVHQFSLGEPLVTMDTATRGNIERCRALGDFDLDLAAAERICRSNLQDRLRVTDR